MKTAYFIFLEFAQILMCATRRPASRGVAIGCLPTCGDGDNGLRLALFPGRTPGWGKGMTRL